MGKHIFLATVLLVLLAGCRSEGTDQTTSTPERYVTALEAYGKIKPAMLEWHKSAVVTKISAPDADDCYVGQDGKASCWLFEVSSPERFTHISYWNGEIIVGFDGISGLEYSGSMSNFAISVADLIDSDEAIHIAQQHGVSTEAPLARIELTYYEASTGQKIPLSWALRYIPEPRGPYKSIYINALTGIVEANDFTQ